MYKPKEMAEKIGVSVPTLQRWDRDGILVAKRNPKGRRYYTEDQYLKYIGQCNQTKRKVVAYTRVSNRSQKDDLENQIEFIKQYCNAKGIIIDDYISDIGSGLNYNRKNWNQLLNRVMNNEIETIYITYKDRFIRFGYEWFERLCQKYDTQIVILNNQKSSPQEELIEDLISIIHVFSGRIYGLRKYKKQIKDDDNV
ncbi:IS607 family transposase [Staphylococcus capitis]|uniref:IS607 family transposase n=1 Tax=Staphylococcus capitis TaxID=29388 RepID=UPI00203C7BA2|nr:IS607 family transposase [Staphylococcus capitis]MCM3508963.1 IS607 family transposase [Staphylococcus capitis]HEK6547232.1 IS607 family transposase [Staphylococcus aureus]